MEARLDYTKASPEAYKAMLQMEGVVRRSGIDPHLLELIKIRASQLNGCAFCIDMHTKDARFKGETEQRIYALDAWRETPFFTEKERAALAWTEALTNIQNGHAPDAVYGELRKNFSEEEIVNITLAITTINAWNRIAIGFRLVPGNYQPSAPH
ncbi:MAG: carboxymuconolactone decarboxylase family protein [Acidobacteriaceae bacterium]